MSPEQTLRIPKGPVHRRNMAVAGGVGVILTGALTCISEKKLLISIPVESCNQLLLMMSSRSCSASSFRASQMSHRRSRKSWAEGNIAVYLSVIKLKSFACLQNVPKENVDLIHVIQQIFILLLFCLKDTKSHAHVFALVFPLD